MATAKQMRANQLNARRSTGPRTPVGKARVGQNAWRHGLTAEKFVLADEDAAEFEALRQECIAHYDPHGPIEASLVDRIAIEEWRWRRVLALEAALFRRPAREQALADAHDQLAAVSGGADRGLFGTLFREQPPSDEARAALDAARADMTAARAQLDSVAMQHIEALERNARLVNLLGRYEGERTRAYYRAMHELERVQARRGGQYVAPAAAMDVTVAMERAPRRDDAA